MRDPTATKHAASSQRFFMAKYRLQMTKKACGTSVIENDEYIIWMGLNAIRAKASSERFLSPVNCRLMRKTRIQTPIPQSAEISFATRSGWPTRRLMRAQISW
jgi:hypothetical protein